MRVQTALKNKGGHTKFVRILQTLFYFPYLLHVSMYLFAHFISFILAKYKEMGGRSRLLWTTLCTEGTSL